MASDVIELPYGAWLDYYCQEAETLQVKYIPANKINQTLLRNGMPIQGGYAIRDGGGYVTHVWDLNELDILLRAQAQSPVPCLRELLSLTIKDLQAREAAREYKRPNRTTKQLPSIDDLLDL